MAKLHTSLLAAALFTSVAAVGLTPALAQMAPAPTNTGPAASEAHHQTRARMMPGQFVDGRIAFLKAELKITPAQEAQWQQVEAAMHENAKALDQTIMPARQNRAGMNAIQRLELRDRFAKVRSENNSRFLAAFKSLYASLSLEQQRHGRSADRGRPASSAPSRLIRFGVTEKPPGIFGGFSGDPKL